MAEAKEDPPKIETASAVAAAPAAPSADELLAQMAGDEIDRLLAEADNGSPTVAPPIAEIPAVAAIAEPTVVVPGEPTATPAAVPETPKEPEAPATVSSVDAVAVAETPAPQAPPVESHAVEPAAVAAPALQHHPEDDEASQSFPALVKLLDVLCSPMESLPSGMLSAIGKIAIVTLVNATGLLVYVKFFRHHAGH
jgi:hypothetical protein